MNPANKLSQRLDYIVKQNSKKIYILKYSKNKLILVLTSNLSLEFTRSSLTLLQVSSLILTLANKLAITIYRADVQCFLIRASNFQIKSLIKVLFLQAIT